MHRAVLLLVALSRSHICLVLGGRGDLFKGKKILFESRCLCVAEEDVSELPAFPAHRTTSHC